MKNKRKIIIAALIFGLFVAFPVAAQKTKSDFQKMYMDFLKKKNMNSSVTADGDISFVIGRNGYYILLNENFPKEFQLFTFITLEGVQLQKSLLAASQVNMSIYGAKIAISNDGKTAGVFVEMLVLKPKDFQQLFDLMVAMIDEAAGEFVSLVFE